MKIDELIEQLEAWAELADLDPHVPYTMGDGLRKAAETIKLLWEIAQDNSNSKYKMQIDEMRGEDET